MPSVYTIEGAARPTRKKKRAGRRGGARTAQQKKFAAAAKACKGGTRREFQSCMRDQLRR
jgi:hypothetical protein